MSPGALVTLELKRALRSSTAFCVRVSLVHSGSRGGGSEEIQEETRFTNNTGAVQVAPEKTRLLIVNGRNSHCNRKIQ